MIWLWIETSASYPGTYAALGSGMIGATDHSEGNRDYRNAWDTNTVSALRRCGECHKKDRKIPPAPDKYTFPLGGTHIDPKVPKYRFDPNIIMNLTRPDKSLMLLEPLAKSAGGYAESLSKTNKESHFIVFKDTSDPDYQALLKAIGKTKDYLDRIKRFDMAGFRPNKHYIREMKVYGFLPEDFSVDDPIDVYALDRKYWESFWHKPKASKQKSETSKQ